jgi:hypothetical protein
MSKDRALDYSRVQAIIEERRRSTKVAPEVQNELGLRKQSSSLTIREAIRLIS